MSESLMDKTRRLQEVAGGVKTARKAILDARRLGQRTGDLRTAAAAPASAVRTWQACAGAGVADLPHSNEAELAEAVAEMSRRIDAGELPPDSAFDAIKRDLTAFARRVEDAVAQAWPPFARAGAASAGLASVRALPPATRQSLGRTVAAVEHAVASVPASPEQVEAFTRHLAVLGRDVEAARVRDLPPQLKPLFDQLGDAGFPLRALTAEQFRLLRENGLADALVLRWAM